MNSTRSFLFLALMPLALGATPASAEQPWQRTLQSGGQIQIDPTTGKANVTTSHGASTMLWDGVHKLQDGSTIIVRDGVVVPDSSMVQARREPVPSRKTDAISPCLSLERQTCGLYGECGETEACALARQLARFEADDSHSGHDALSWSRARCQDALTQPDSFKPCAVRSSKGRVTPCTQLATSVCGAGRCADSAACQAARQLVDMEYEERLGAVNREIVTDTGAQCRQAKRDGGFFAPCSAASATQ